MKTLIKTIVAAGALMAMSIGVNAATLEQQAAQILQSRGYWCPVVDTITPHMFGNSPNHSSYNVFCDDGRQAVNYTMKVGRNGSYIEISER